MNQKSLLRKQTSINTFQFGISNLSPDSKPLKLAVFSDFQRHWISRHSFKESCLQNLKAAEFSEQSYGPGAQPQGDLRMREGQSLSLRLRSLSMKGRERHGVLGFLVGKTHKRMGPQTKCILGKTIDSIKNQSHKRTQTSQTKHNWSEMRPDPINNPP